MNHTVGKTLTKKAQTHQGVSRQTNQRANTKQVNTVGKKKTKKKQWCVRGRDRTKSKTKTHDRE